MQIIELTKGDDGGTIRVFVDKISYIATLRDDDEDITTSEIGLVGQFVVEVIETPWEIEQLIEATTNDDTKEQA